MAEAEADAAGYPAAMIVLAAVVVIAVVAGLIVVFGPKQSTAPPRDRLAEAKATAASWLGAWSADDRKAMGRLLADPATGLQGALDAWDGVRPASIRATAGLPVVNGRTAVVPFDATVDVQGLGPWRFSGSLPLVDVDVKLPDVKRPERQWRVSFSPAVLHPDLAPGARLVVVRTWSTRGRLLAADGTPLPAGHQLRFVLGTTGPASAAQAKALGDAYRPGDVVGQTGLQAAEEQTLAGRPSGVVQLRRGSQVVKEEASFTGSPGQDVRTTLDLRVQSAAEAALGTAGNGAAMVVLRPSTGGILAVVNRPPGGYARSLMGRYPPGSTFKVITTMALLQKGVTPDTRVSCPKEITVNGRTIQNAENEELGDIDLRQAFAHSCNTAFIQLAQRLTGDDLAAAAHLLGFDSDPGLGAAAATSQFPKPSGVIDLVSSAIGQGRVLVTPFQMASVAASVASGGYRKPHFVDPPGGVGFTALPAGTAGTIQALMRLVVTQGTGVKANVPGTPVFGKTGTAEFGTVPPLKTDAWFISFRGDLASSVVVEDSGLGGDFAAPIAADFYRRVGG